MSGIKLNIDNEGEVSLFDGTEKLECFGGFMCSNLKIGEDGFWICGHSGRPVSYHYYTNKKCPQNHWIMMALPFGAQNLTEIERRKWYEDRLDKPSEEPGEGYAGERTQRVDLDD